MLLLFLGYEEKENNNGVQVFYFNEKKEDNI